MAIMPLGCKELMPNLIFRGWSIRGAGAKSKKFYSLSFHGLVESGNENEKPVEMNIKQKSVSIVSCNTQWKYLLEPFHSIDSVAQSGLVDAAKTSFTNLEMFREVVCSLAQLF